MTALALTAVGCATTQPRTVTRIVDGRVQKGPFIPPYAYAWFIRGEVAATQGRYDAAVVAFESARATPSEDPYLLSRLADAHQKAGDRSAAIDVVTETGDTGQYWLTEGNILASKKKNVEALLAYQKAELSVPGRAKRARARLLASMGHSARAQQLLNSLPDRTGHKRSGRRAALKLALDRGDPAAVALAKAPDHRSDRRVVDAVRSALTQQRPALANSLLELVPEHAVEPALRIKAWLSVGRRDRVEHYLVAGKGRTKIAPLERARLLLVVDRPALALDIASQYRRARAYLLVGHALAKLGRFEHAASSYAKVPPGAVDFEEARAGLTLSLVASGRAGLAQEIRSHR